MLHIGTIFFHAADINIYQTMEAGQTFYTRVSMGLHASMHDSDNMPAGVLVGLTDCVDKCLFPCPVQACKHMFPIINREFMGETHFKMVHKNLNYYEEMMACIRRNNLLICDPSLFILCTPREAFEYRLKKAREDAEALVENASKDLETSVSTTKKRARKESSIRGRATAKKQNKRGRVTELEKGSEDESDTSKKTTSGSESESDTGSD
jgi:hypothetical protein